MKKTGHCPRAADARHGNCAHLERLQVISGDGGAEEAPLIFRTLYISYSVAAEKVSLIRKRDREKRVI